MGANKKYMDEGKAVLITKVVFGFLGVESVSEDILHILCRRMLSRDFDSCRLLKQPPAYHLRGATKYVWYELHVGDIDVSWMKGSGRPRILCAMFDNFSIQQDAFCGSVRLYLIGSSRWIIDTIGCDKAEIEDSKFELEPLMVAGALFGQSGADPGYFIVNGGFEAGLNSQKRFKSSCGGGSLDVWLSKYGLSVDFSGDKSNLDFVKFTDARLASILG